MKMTSFVLICGALLTPSLSSAAPDCRDVIGKVYLGLEGQGVDGNDGSVSFRNGTYADVVWPNRDVSENCRYRISGTSLLLRCESGLRNLRFSTNCNVIRSRTAIFRFGWRS